jgi:ferredoxin-nitrite reductase
MQGVMQSQLWGGQLTGALTAGVRKLQDGYLGVRASAEREVKAKAVAAPPPALTEDRLVSRVQERDGYWVLKEEFQKGINPSEKIKLAKEPMKFFTENEIEELARTPFAELDSTKPGKDDIDVRLKWLGLFHRRKHQYGRFMMRFKLPNGITNSTQTRFLAETITKYGKEGCADLTTRQNWQIRGIVLEEVPALLKGLESVGLSSLQSGMDNVRNAVGNPLAGIDPHEIVDTAPFCRALNDYIINSGKGNTQITNLPRKWNVCVVGTHDLFEHPHINDLAYMPAMKNGVFGFNILVGGFFSPKRCAEAIPMDAWVPEKEVVPLCKAILETYRDLGSRGNRQKTRMMWLIDEMGIEDFRAQVESRMDGGRKIERSGEDLVDPSWKRRSFYGVNPQKQEGLNYIGLHVPVGRLQAPEMFELARIADEYGNGEIRITVEQNLILPNVPTEKVEKLMKEPLLEKYSPNPTPLLANLVACTGSQFCGQGIAETKARSLELTTQLDATMETTRPIRLHFTGCPNTCAQVQVADIGFMGTMARDENRKPVEGFDIYLGGRIGSDSHLGELIRPGVPATQLLPVVQELMIEHFGAKRKA